MTAVVWATLAGGGCSVPIDPAAAAKLPEGVEAQGIVDLLARGEVPALEARVDPSQRRPETADELRKMAALFPAGAPVRERLVGYDLRSVRQVGVSTTERHGFTWERNYAGANLVAQVVWQRVDAGEWRLVGLHADRVPAPLDELNAFTFTGKGPLHYLFLVLMAAVAGVTVVAIVMWFRRRRSIRRRWLWLLAIVVGAFELVFNWTTGELAVHALSFHLFSLAFGKAGPFAPAILSLSLPAGAIAFLFRLREEKARAAGPAGGLEAGPPRLEGPPPGETPTGPSPSAAPTEAGR